MNLRDSIRAFSLSAALTAAVGIAPGSFAQGTGSYAAFSLEREENWTPLITEDMNGDGLLDLVYADYDATLGRQLLIHYQNASGDFPSSPQVIEIKSEIIAIGFGDLREELGTELILHAANGVFSLSPSIEGYSGNLQPIMRFDSIATIASRKQVEFLPPLEDRSGDSILDLLLPTEKGFAFFKGSRSGEFKPAGSIETVNADLLRARRNDRGAGLDTNLGINATEGIVVKVAVERRNPFDEFVKTWSGQTEEVDLVNSSNWIPNTVFADINGDALLDLVFINLDSDANPQLNVALQEEEGFVPSPSWVTSMDAGGEISLADFNGDGRSDLLRLSGSGDDWEARFYLSKKADSPFDLSAPDQVMRFSGYDVRLNAVPLPTGAIALSVSYYTLPIIDAIRSASINRTQLLYAPLTSAPGETGSTAESALFARRPSSQLIESFSAANVRGLSEQMSLAFDIDGDGANDALYITERGTLAAKRVDDSLSIETDPFWEYVSDKTVFEFDVLSLNNDSTPDLILRHGNSITVLVSRGGTR